MFDHLFYNGWICAKSHTERSILTRARSSPVGERRHVKRRGEIPQAALTSNNAMKLVWSDQHHASSGGSTVVFVVLVYLCWGPDNLCATHIIMTTFMPWMRSPWLHGCRDEPVSRVTHAGAHAKTVWDQYRLIKQEDWTPSLQISGFHSLVSAHTHTQLLISFQ